MQTIAIKRSSFTLLAMLLGVGPTYGLTYVGTKTEGPLDAVLQNVGSGVAKLEVQYLLEGRTHTRAQALAWFRPYRNDLARLRQPDHILLGAFDDNTSEGLQPIAALEDSLRTHLPIVQLYSA